MSPPGAWPGCCTAQNSIEEEVILAVPDSRSRIVDTASLLRSTRRSTRPILRVGQGQERSSSGNSTPEMRPHDTRGTSPEPRHVCRDPGQTPRWVSPPRTGSIAWWREVRGWYSPNQKSRPRPPHHILIRSGLQPHFPAFIGVPVREVRPKTKVRGGGHHPLHSSVRQ